jgi:hypothetical protein
MRDARVPPEACAKVRVEVERQRQTINIVERARRAAIDSGPEWSRLPVARLRYVGSKGPRTLSHLRRTGRWERYPLLGRAAASTTYLASWPMTRSACSGTDRSEQGGRAARDAERAT